MRRSPRPSNTSNLSEIVQHQLNMYALAAGAGGVSMLALAQPAEAKIIYTPSHVRIGLHGAHDYRLDLNHDGTTDFNLKIVTTTAMTFKGYALGVYGQKHNLVESTRHGGAHWALALKRGQSVNCKPSCSSIAWMAHIRYNNSGQASTYSWINVTNRYLGLKFTIKGKPHYGWARLNVKVVGHKLAATLTGYAYETVPNKPIVAGKTEDDPDMMVEPATLGHLAAGGAAIPGWRVK